jgi:Raf kinase inhibitor-like YbhB/YbcL family protein
MTFTLKSDAFEYGGMIPKEFTCQGENISPSLKWDGVHKNTKTLALICEDPDAPGGTWIHWVIYNIPGDKKSLPKDFPRTKLLDDGTKQGTNDFGRIGYGGPCPPHGIHSYIFKLYALDSALNLQAGVNNLDVMSAMQNHILEKCELMGKYGKL